MLYSSSFLPNAAAAAKSLQLCPTLCNPIDGSPPGSPVPGILQARVLEWGAIAFSRVTIYPSDSTPIYILQKIGKHMPTQKLVDEYSQ